MLEGPPGPIGLLSSLDLRLRRARGRNRTDDLPLTRRLLWPTELHGRRPDGRRALSRGLEPVRVAGRPRVRFGLRLRCADSAREGRSVGVLVPEDFDVAGLENEAERRVVSACFHG